MTPRALFGRLRTQLGSALDAHQTIALEYLLASHALFVGLLYLAPWWTSFGPVVRDWTIVGALSEETWGWLFVLGGGGWLLGLQARRPRWCKWAAVGLAIVWAYLWNAIWLVAPTGWLTPIMGLPFAGCLWVEVRLDRRWG